MDNFNNQNNQPYQYQQDAQYNQNQPYQYPQYQEQPESGKNFAIASLVLGILSLVCCGSFIFSVLGVIFGVISRQRQKENNGMATAGLVLSIIGIVFSIIGIIFAVSTGFLADYLASTSYYY